MKSIILTLLSALALASSAGERVKVACIGDSITYGYGLADRANESYPAQLQRMLDEKFPGRYEVRNFGNSGRGIYLDSMRGAEKRGFRWMPEHKAALEWKPDVVICNLGINDNGEYIKEYAGGRRRGQFADDYIALLGDYRKAKAKVKLFLWTKLSPLAEGQRFYRSPEPFLMQADLEKVAAKMQATGLDMQEPLREQMDEIFARDKIHPNVAGARIIAETTFKALTEKPVYKALRAPSAKRRVETWLCAGQSNMQKGWGEFNATPAEKERVRRELKRLEKVAIYFWDFNDGSWTRLTPANALGKCAFGVSFAIRRAEKTGKTIQMLYVAAGGAPTESFLSEQTMCAVGKDGKPRYPHLAAIATNRHRLDQNADFPCAWVAREYPRRRGDKSEAFWLRRHSLVSGRVERHALRRAGGAASGGLHRRNAAGRHRGTARRPEDSVRHDGAAEDEPSVGTVSCGAKESLRGDGRDLRGFLRGGAWRNERRPSARQDRLCRSRHPGPLKNHVVRLRGRFLSCGGPKYGIIFACKFRYCHLCWPPTLAIWPMTLSGRRLRARRRCISTSWTRTLCPTSPSVPMSWRWHARSRRDSIAMSI